MSLPFTDSTKNGDKRYSGKTGVNTNTFGPDAIGTSVIKNLKRDGNSVTVERQSGIQVGGYGTGSATTIRGSSKGVNVRNNR